MGSTMLGRQKGIQMSYQYLSLALLRLKLVLKIWKGVTLQVLIEFHLSRR